MCHSEIIEDLQETIAQHVWFKSTSQTLVWMSCFYLSRIRLSCSPSVGYQYASTASAGVWQWGGPVHATDDIQQRKYILVNYVGGKKHTDVYPLC